MPDYNSNEIIDIFLDSHQ